jgi:hypothetical protein
MEIKLDQMGEAKSYSLESMQKKAVQEFLGYIWNTWNPDPKSIN